MRTSTKSLGLIAFALAPLSSAWETQVEYQGSNLTLIHGEVKVNNDLSKRSVPSECNFEGPRGDFYYTQITGLKEGTACFGYSSEPTCGPGSWGDPDFTDIQDAIAKQVTKDGQLEGSTSGDWDAGFSLFTTAFSDRNSAPFDLALAVSKEKALVYYWSRDYDFASVVGHDAICP